MKLKYFWRLKGLYVCFLQVSRCEKFGYGVMVTQVAATAPGVVALHSSGTTALTSTNKQLTSVMLKACISELLLCS